jgi:hypothetical protein
MLRADDKDATAAAFLNMIDPVISDLGKLVRSKIKITLVRGDEKSKRFWFGIIYEGKEFATVNYILNPSCTMLHREHITVDRDAFRKLFPSARVETR